MGAPGQEEKVVRSPWGDPFLTPNKAETCSWLSPDSSLPGFTHTSA